jgi:hypothetical protein
MWRALCLLLLSLPGWAAPFATASIMSDQVTHCDYEDTTTGETARVPVVIDTQRGEAPNYRVCKVDIAHWAPGSVRVARMRSVLASGALSEWTAATLDRPAAATVAVTLIGSPAPPPDPQPPMASISENGTSVANFTAVAGGGLLTNGSAFINSGDSQYDASAHNISMDSGNHTVSAVVGNKGLYSYVDLTVRGNGASGSGLNCWRVTIGTAPGGDEYYITEVTGGAGIDRASGSTSFSNGAAFSAEADGTTIRLKINGTTIASYTSTLYQTNKRVGAGIYRVLVATTLSNFAASDNGGASASNVAQRRFPRAILNF